jgi:hypothetical protein
MIPKVKFIFAEKEEHIENTAGFFNPEFGWDCSEQILTEYPKLREKIGNEKNGKKKKQIAKKFLEKFYDTHKNELIERTNIFQKSWDKINDKIMIALEDIIEENWPENDKEMFAAIGLNPICPRDIIGRYFLVFYKMNEYEAIRTIIHEILHFLWFEKWKTIFPEAGLEDLDPPSIPWKLSEIVPLAILSDERIQKIFKHYPVVYDEWQVIKINDKPLLEHIQEFYDKKKDFEDFVRRSFDFIKQNSEALK